VNGGRSGRRRRLSRQICRRNANGPALQPGRENQRGFKSDTRGPKGERLEVAAHQFREALHCLFTTIEALGFLQFLERFVMGGLGLFDLIAQLADRVLQIVPARTRRAGIGGIGEMSRIGIARALFLDGDFPVPCGRTRRSSLRSG